MNRAQIHFLKLTNPDTAVRSRWGAGILIPPPTVSGGTILCSHPSCRAELAKILSSIIQVVVLTYCYTSPLLSLNMMSCLCTVLDRDLLEYKRIYSWRIDARNAYKQICQRKR